MDFERLLVSTMTFHERGKQVNLLTYPIVVSAFFIQKVFHYSFLIKLIEIKRGNMFE